MRTKTTNRDFQPNFCVAYYQNNQLMGAEAWDDEVGKLNIRVCTEPNGENGNVKQSKKII